MRILVTGLVGNLVARRLMSEGHTVRALARRAETVLKLKQIFREAVLGDITRPEATNQIDNVADAKVKIADMIRVIAETLHYPFPTKHANRVSAFRRSMLNQSASNPARMSLDLFFPLWRGVTSNAEKIRRELGWEPRIPSQDSVRAGALEWLPVQPKAE